jgi:eukaryotic-like serine/threonine-protein kinase
MGRTMPDPRSRRASRTRKPNAAKPPLDEEAGDRVPSSDQYEYPPLPPDGSPVVRALEAILAETPAAALTRTDSSEPASEDSEGDRRSSTRIPLPAIDGYEVLGLLGHGGMGVVYKARQTRLNRLVAIKTLLAGPAAGPELLARFRIEAGAAARLQHPNIVQIYEIAEPDGVPFFSMEYVGGGNLEERIRRRSFAPATAAKLLEKLAGAVQAAHASGVIHRDLKPSNVLITSDGVPKISDFGLAKQLEPSAGNDVRTRTGAVLGTPNYMAPEQTVGTGAPIGPGADVYALGAILYELLTGRPPFRAADYWQTLEQVRTREPVSPARLRPGLPADLVTICLKCLEKDPGRRYLSAADLAAELRLFRSGRPITARRAGALERALKWTRRRPWQAALLGTVLLGIVTALASATWYDRRHLQETRRVAVAEAEAKGQRLRVLANFEKGHETLGKLLTRMEQDDSRTRDPRTLSLQREVEEAALRYYADVLKDVDGDTDADARLTKARVLNYSAEACRLLGRSSEALVDLGGAKAVLQSLLVEQPKNATYRTELADCAYHKADIELGCGQPKAAEAGFLEALKLDESIAGSAEDLTAALKNQACCYWRLSSLYEFGGRADQAAESAASAAASWTRLLDGEPANAVLRSRLGLALKEQVRLEVARGRPHEAEAAIQRAVTVLSPMLNPLPRDLDTLWGPVWLAEVYRESALLMMAGTPRPREAVANYTKAIRILDSVLAREPQLLRGRVVQSQVYLYRSMAYEALGRISDMIHDREQSCAFADGIHHAISRADFARCLARVGRHRRAVSEAKAGAASPDLPLEWRLAVARTCSLAMKAARMDPAVAESERSHLEDEYAAVALPELCRCRDEGYFADENNRKALATDADFETIRSRADVQDFIRKLTSGASLSRSAPAAAVPAGNR